MVAGNDPLLARVAWAAVLMDTAGWVVGQGYGPVCGLQSAPWAELSAAFLVAEGSTGAALVVSDFDYGWAGMGALVVRPGG